MSFTDTQIKALSAKLNGKHVRARRHDGIELSYLEGWHVISEANRIFGFDAWNRETVHSQCVWQSNCKDTLACSYIARVRISVRAGENIVVREGSGSGHGRSQNAGEAHESALKEAETDATKRALATFGNAFGLALYDKEQREVRRARTAQPPKQVQGQMTWPVISDDGRAQGTFNNPVDFCSAIKVKINHLSSAMDAINFWARNEEMVGKLREVASDLVTEKGQHYADILIGLYTDKLATFEIPPDKNEAQPPASNVQRTTRKKSGTIIVGSSAPSSKPKRQRDPAHLKFVAKHACLVCGRMPTQAHHVRFVQPRAMGKKVSDEWTVPLCTTHHDHLHRVGNEEMWWLERKIDPLKEAMGLWKESQGGETEGLRDAS